MERTWNGHGTDMERTWNGHRTDIDTEVTSYHPIVAVVGVNWAAANCLVHIALIDGQHTPVENAELSPSIVCLELYQAVAEALQLFCRRLVVASIGHRIPTYSPELFRHVVVEELGRLLHQGLHVRSLLEPFRKILPSLVLFVDQLQGSHVVGILPPTAPARDLTL